MAPIVLKIKGDKTFSPFSALASEEDLSQAWRVCSKVKDSLEQGSRLENLSWRLWHRQHTIAEGLSFKKLSATTARKLSSHCSIMPSETTKIETIEYSGPVHPLETNIMTTQQGIPMIEQNQPQLRFPDSFYNSSSQNNSFSLSQFNSQAPAVVAPPSSSSNVVELDDIFNAFNSSFAIPTAPMDMADGWDFGIPSPTNPYYSPSQSTSTTPPLLPQSGTQVNTSSIPQLDK
ncbi:hypothetical protein BD560DRAFT_434736, partial [Blakeslea trispora]